MISEIYPVCIGLTAVAITIFYLRYKKTNPWRIFLWAAFILYLTGVICVTLFPMDYTNTVHEDFIIWENTLKPIPFNVISQMFHEKILIYILVQIGGNILMTIPLGIMLPLLRPGKKKWFYPLFFLCFTVAIESSQLLIGALLRTFYRTTDIDDVILNFTGAMIGMLIYRLLPQKFKQRFL